MNRFPDNRDNTRWRGDIRPFTPRRQTPDLASYSFIVAGEGEWMTHGRIYLKPARPIYPSPGLFLSIRNANGGVFARLRDLSALDALAGFILAGKAALTTSYSRADDLARAQHTLVSSLIEQNPMLEAALRQADNQRDVEEILAQLNPQGGNTDGQRSGAPSGSSR